MENTVEFSDHTIDLTVQLQLPVPKIERMCAVLQKYAVSCYDITLKSVQ